MATTHSPRDGGPYRVLALAGSLRRGSYNRALLVAAAEVAPAGLAITLDPEFPALPLFDEDLERDTHGGPDAVLRLRERVIQADALLIATPEYNQSLPGLLKNGLDWLSRPLQVPVLPAKPVAILGATPGPWGTRLAQHALRQVLTATDCRVMPNPPFFVRDAAQTFDAEGRLAQEGTRERLAKFLVAFASWIDLVSPRQSR